MKIIYFYKQFQKQNLKNTVKNWFITKTHFYIFLFHLENSLLILIINFPFLFNDNLLKIFLYDNKLVILFNICSYCFLLYYTRIYS